MPWLRPHCMPPRVVRSLGQYWEYHILDNTKRPVRRRFQVVCSSRSPKRSVRHSIRLKRGTFLRPSPLRLCQNFQRLREIQRFEKIRIRGFFRREEFRKNPQRQYGMGNYRDFEITNRSFVTFRNQECLRNNSFRAFRTVRELMPFPKEIRQRVP